MEKEKDTFEDAVTDIIITFIFERVDREFREKLKKVLEERDPNKLRELMKKLSRGL
jgi:hypothetical protein